MQELLWLLLPLAAASGWFAARRSLVRKPKGPLRQPPSYFKGLNHLLNEEPDKAIDVFVQLLEVDSDTVETHLALGNLFRRRGEVERAIRIHQNLIARPALTSEERGQALLELGQDYMRAGLFDRAESLFRELSEMQPYARQALRNLQTIYEHEKDWQSCLEVVNRLEPLQGEPLNVQKAQYFCELAELELGRGDHGAASALLKKALAARRECIRALHLQARMLRDNDDCKGVIRLLNRVVEQDVLYLPEVLPDLVECHNRQGSSAELKKYLFELMERMPSENVLVTLGDLIRDTEGREAAAVFLLQALLEHPSLVGLLHLVRLNVQIPAADAQQVLQQLEVVLATLLRDQPGYQCQHCGYSAKTMHWQCPSCRHWGTIKHKAHSLDCQQITP